VSVTLRAESPMTPADHVRAMAIFTEQNPQPNVATFRFGPRAGRAVVNTRMRLATSQKVVAIAGYSDGSYWSDQVEVIVTLAACVE
jgi:sulfur-oxidizing protein SoxY